jgi:aspartate-semialdehyde dehydrogenase
MNEAGYGVAVVGATAALGREVRAVLHERLFPVREWRLVDCLDRIEQGGEDDLEAPLVRSEDFEVDPGTAIVFLCATDVEPARRRFDDAPGGAVLIDLTQGYADRSDVPLIVPEVNASLIADAEASGVVCSPAPGAVALSVALRPLEDVARLRRVVVTACEPVSSAGSEAIEELARQTRDLLSGCSTESAVFGQRIAFNLIPQVGDLLAGGKARGEWQIESQTRRILALHDLPIHATAIRVPAFFGQGYAVDVETELPLDAASARDLLRQAPGVVLFGDEGPASRPTLIDALETDAVCLGRLRDDPTVPCGLSLWLTIDGARKGGAVNAVQIAELLVRAGR